MFFFSSSSFQDKLSEAFYEEVLGPAEVINQEDVSDEVNRDWQLIDLSEEITYSLAEHTITDNPPVVANPASHCCELCSKMFTTKHGLAKHTHRISGKLNLFHIELVYHFLADSK